MTTRRSFIRTLAALQTRSWVVCCHKTPLGRANPGIVIRTAFGDPLYHNLCPSNADVRMYLRALVKDGAALRPLLSQPQALIPDREITVGVQVGMPESGGRVEYLDRMKTAREMGITSFNFYNYGFIPLKNLEWVSESLSPAGEQ